MFLTVKNSSSNSGALLVIFVYIFGHPTLKNQSQILAISVTWMINDYSSLCEIVGKLPCAILLQHSQASEPIDSMPMESFLLLTAHRIMSKVILSEALISMTRKVSRVIRERCRFFFFSFSYFLQKQAMTRNTMNDFLESE